MTVNSKDALMAAGIRGEFFESMARAPQHYLRLATRIQSRTAVEQFRFLGHLPSMRQMLSDGRRIQTLAVESYDVASEVYECTCSATRSEFDDDQTGQIRARVQEMAQAAATFKDYEISQLLIHGDEAGYNSYDGVPFFSASHESFESGAQDNTQTSAAATGTQPTVAEFQEALATAIQRILGFKDDRGNMLNLAPTGLVAVVPPNMYMVALTALGGTVIAATDNVLKGAADLIVMPWLVSETAEWYLLKADTPICPFIWLDRDPIEFEARERGSDSAFYSETYVWGARDRHKMTYGRWSGAVKHTFT
ncbi:MAG TPA: Mu-like prophage major head subunit gpT family protein [Phycisphaerae bacterium]|nr:Mu-like prophage major head subunit gpT family protein [Phycisphaerae bacterium]HNU46841.1 Mu-like prophage major head subunit gpT family protein [Phycisphaerae bacterium]